MFGKESWPAVVGKHCCCESVTFSEFQHPIFLAGSSLGLYPSGSPFSLRGKDIHGKRATVSFNVPKFASNAYTGQGAV